MPANSRRILTINPGSSSIKLALYEDDETPARTFHAEVDRIGEAGATFASHEAAIAALLDRLPRSDPASAAVAAGLRVVHGGSRYRAPERVTDALVGDLQRLAELDPDHLPQALAVIGVVQQRNPNLPLVACFDTAFHRTLPRVAQMYPLPRRFFDAGVIRYGFHGLSCEYVLQELRRLDSERARGRVVIAHLGNGASMTAVRDGRSVDTTMGFTPAGGMMMGTRPGDLDPGVLIYLQQSAGMSTADLNALVNRQSGLLGVSDRSGDMRDLLAAEATDAHAADAVALFGHLARRALGGLAATLGGLDLLVFTGGIGEHAAPVRARICDGLAFMGIEIDSRRNERNDAVISPDGRAVVVRVMKTDEDLMIARHVREVLKGG